MCVAMEYEAADKELNQIYKSLRERLSAADRKSLLLDERAWMKQRDTTCRPEATDDDDTPESPGQHLYDSGQENNCMAELTKARIKVLKDRLQELRTKRSA